MKWWMYAALTVLGFSGILVKYPEQLGRLVSNVLKEKLGKIGGRRLERIIHEGVDAFQKGLRYDNGGTDEEVTPGPADPRSTLIRHDPGNRPRGRGWGR